MDQNDNRRVSRRLIEKGLTSEDQTCDRSRDKKQLKTGRKTKANAKNVKLKENEKITANSGKESAESSPAIDSSQRKYGLRKLAPINWKERLDTRHLTSDTKSDKTKDTNHVKSNGRVNNKVNNNKVNNNKVNKDKKITVNNKVNGKITDNQRSRKHKLKELEVKNQKKMRKRRNGSLVEVNDNASEGRSELHIDSMEASDLCDVRPVATHNGTSDAIVEQQQLSDPLNNISYFQFLEKFQNNVPSVPSFSLKEDRIIKLLSHKPKTKAQININTTKSNNRRKLYSCGNDLCDSKWCQSGDQ